MGLRQFCIYARLALVSLSCAAVAQAAGAQRIPDNGLEQAWLQAAYAVNGTSSGYAAENVAQHLEVSFAPSETHLTYANYEVALRLAAYGRADELRLPGPVRLLGSGSRVEYRYGPLTEWYVNEARGLEQGFTLVERPAGHGGLMIALDLAGGLRPSLESRDAVALLDSNGHAVLRYGDLKAWDAQGRSLDSRLEVHGRRIRLMVEDGPAVYPITIDPMVTSFPLVASDGVSSDNFGQSVSLSGGTAVFGAYHKQTLRGAAYVFVQSGSSWIQQAKLTAADGAIGDLFGVSVSVSGDTLVVGASGKTSGQGTAYIFVRSGTSWTQQAELTASDAAPGDQFGASVSVNAGTVVIGASSQLSGQGSAYVFVQSGTNWTQQAKLTASDAATGDQFGASVSLNGGTAVVGAPGKASNQGAAYVFLQSGTSWTQQAKLVASGGAAADSFGNSVSVSQNTAVVGAYARNASQGAAYVFVRSGTNWSQQAELTASDGKAGDSLGRSVSVDGSIVVAGANALFFNTGAAYVFVSSGANWIQQAKLSASDATQSYQFAFSVSVSGDTVAIGAPIQNNGAGEGYFFASAGSNWSQQAEVGALDRANPDDFGWSISVSGDTAVVGALFKNNFQGAAYVFVRSGPGWMQQAKLLPSDAAGGEFGNVISIDGDTVVVGAESQASATGAAYVFVRSGTAWTQQAKLTASDGAANAYFGSSIAVNGDTAVIGSSGHNSSQGAAYVFVRTGSSWAQQAELIASDSKSLGSAAAIDGDTATVGAYGNNSSQGALYVFVRSGATWTQQAELSATGGTKDQFLGYSTAIKGDTAIVGAPYGGPGAAYVFVRSGTSWSQQAKLTASDGAMGNAFGYVVSMDGSLAVVGAPESHAGAGAVYVFTLVGTNWVPLPEFNTADGVAGDNLGWSASISAGTVVAGAIGKNSSQGQAYVFLVPIISVGGVTNAAATASQTVAPGSIASIFGINFANSNASAGTLPLPETLNGVGVVVNTTIAPLIFAGPLQANVQIPFETAPGTANVVVTVGGIPSPPAMVTVAAVAPDIFVTGTNQAVVINPDNSVADSGHPAKVGTVVVMYVTGLGALDHPIPTGSPASSNPLSDAKVVPTVTIGGVKAAVSFAGMTPGSVGLGQINMAIPKMAAGTYPVVVTQGGHTSNMPVMSITP